MGGQLPVLGERLENCSGTSVLTAFVQLQYCVELLQQAAHTTLYCQF